MASCSQQENGPEVALSWACRDRNHFLLMTVCGWLNRRQLAAIDYLREQNRVLREQLGTKRLVFSDAQRRRLALKGKALSRELLNEVCSIVTPDTILR